MTGRRIYLPFQAGLLAGFWLLGETITRAFGLPFPGSMLGLGLLLALLGTRRLDPKYVRDGADAFLGNMLLFFVPAIVALIDHQEFFSLLGIKLMIAVLVATLVTMAAAGLVARFHYRRRHG